MQQEGRSRYIYLLQLEMQCGIGYSVLRKSVWGSFMVFSHSPMGEALTGTTNGALERQARDATLTGEARGWWDGSFVWSWSSFPPVSFR